MEYLVEVWFEGEFTPDTLAAVNDHKFFGNVTISEDSSSEESASEIPLTKFVVNVDAYTANDALNHVTAEILAALAPTDFDGYLRKTTVTLL